MSVSQSFRKAIFPGSQCQRLECSHTIDYGTPESREGTFRRNKTFDEGIKTLHTTDCQLITDWGRKTVLAARFQYLDIHGMNNERIIIIQRKFRSVGIPSVTKIPFIYFIKAGSQGITVRFFTDGKQESLYHVTKQ